MLVPQPDPAKAWSGGLVHKAAGGPCKVLLLTVVARQRWERDTHSASGIAWLPNARPIAGLQLDAAPVARASFDRFLSLARTSASSSDRTERELSTATHDPMPRLR